MDHRDQDPSSGPSADPSKTQSARQPTDPAPSQADHASAGQHVGESDTTTEQRDDIEGGTATGQATDRDAGLQFVGARGASDTSTELIEDDDDRRGDGE